MTTRPATIDEYLAAAPDAQRAALERLRKLIHRAAPGAEEGVSYGLPTIRLGGRPLVAFAATAKHCALYPLSALTIETHRDDLRDFDTSKGTIRFQPEKPLPASLVRKLVQSRIEENARKRIA
jgi:uncharacterized protein YdhG (YjbR/CyaY superfamily)